MKYERVLAGILTMWMVAEILTPRPLPRFRRRRQATTDRQLLRLIKGEECVCNDRCPRRARRHRSMCPWGTASTSSSSSSWCDCLGRPHNRENGHPMCCLCTPCVIYWGPWGSAVRDWPSPGTGRVRLSRKRG